jgi:NADP-dependent 3-hydroxy acid dehydrogenase YdfG
MKIVITGTTSGIGQATKELLEKNGHEVISFNRPNFDLHQLDQLNNIDLQGIDILINNAGHDLGRHNFLDAPYPGWLNVMKCNQLAPMLLTQLFVRQNTKGIVIFMTTHFDQGSIHGGAYHIAKAGLKFFIEMIRRENKNFRFVDFSLGRIKTKMRENWKVPLTDEEKNYTGSKGFALEPIDIAEQVLHVINNENVTDIFVKHPKR